MSSSVDRYRVWTLTLLKNSFYSDSDNEYEQIKAKLEEFDNTDAEVEDYEDEGYLVPQRETRFNVLYF